MRQRKSERHKRLGFGLEPVEACCQKNLKAMSGNLQDGKTVDAQECRKTITHVSKHKLC